jgi:uncharacterized protein (TIGR02172 family)
MKIHATKNGTCATVFLDGRLDSTTSPQAQADIDAALASLAPVERVVCDATRLDYISSSGLRILLSLCKRFPGFRLANVNNEVHEILEMTGFTKIMGVERAMRSLSVDGCEEIGRGGIGTVYRIDGDSIIKVFREGTTLDEVTREITLSREAFVLGMPTAISFDVVRVGKSYGLVYELLKAETLSQCIRKDPARLGEFARLYAGLFRQLHAIRVPPADPIPDAAAREEAAIRRISRHFDAGQTDILLAILSAIPRADRLVHGDLQTKNAMLRNGEPMLIDMGEVGFGHPLIDLGHACSAMYTFIGDYETVIGMPRATGAELWRRTMRCYFDGLPEAEFAHRMEQIEAASAIRNFTWMSLSDSFPEEVVNECREAFGERVAKRKDYLLDVAATFADWTLPEA